MSIRTIACSSSNRNCASARAVSVLPTPVGPRKMNEPIGRFGSLDPAARGAPRGRPRHERVVLADDAQPELVLHAQELRLLALEHLRDGDPGPLRDDLGDLLGSDLLGEQRALLLDRGEAL